MSRSRIERCGATLRRFPWTLATAALAVAATAGVIWASGIAHALAEPLVADARGVSRGEAWRLFTGPLVHTTWSHLSWDLSILVAIGSVYEPRIRDVWPWMLLLGLAVPTAAVFLAHPELTYYYGASGLTHAAMGAAVVFELTSGRVRWWGVTGGVFVVAKIGWGMLGPGPLVEPELGARVHEVPIAHLAGGLAGAFAVVSARWRACSRRRQPCASLDLSQNAEVIDGR